MNELEIADKLVDILSLESTKTPLKRVVKAVPGLRQCVRCKTSVFGGHRHHICYEPEMTEILCNNCHSKITQINVIASVVVGKLENRTRIKLWNWFLKFRGTVTESKVAEVLGLKDFVFTAGHYIRIKNGYKIKPKKRGK